MIGYGQITLQLIKSNGSTALRLKKVFQQKYHAFEGVKSLENTHFLSTYRIKTDNNCNHWHG